MNNQSDSITMTPETAYMPEDVNWRVLTPTQAARLIARFNAHLSPALIMVRSWTVSGRYGRNGWTTKRTAFVAVDGRANPRGRKSNGAEVRINGACHVCGKVFAEYALQFALGKADYIPACPSCIAAHSMCTLATPLDTSLLLWAEAYARPACPPAYAYRMNVDLTQQTEFTVTVYGGEA